MDRGEVVEVDHHEGLKTTLVVLGHKLRHSSIGVVRLYDAALPKALVYGSELNRLWTNLLDNPIDAIGERAPSPSPAGSTRAAPRSGSPTTAPVYPRR